ncbi:hypothetical protein ABI59_08375 [Acidobacteria bacterium Mor1]|nr:hypothetical protein ABI59_08375 [Acidobacteria bacterium Mor1]
MRNVRIDSRNPQSGLTLAEVLVSLGILAMAMLAVSVFISASFHQTRHNADKDFAVQKSIAILEELKSIVEINDGQDVTLLDDYDDGISYNNVLTVQDGVTHPAHAASGNLANGTGWQYERQVSVQKFASLQANDVRLVNVKVFGWVEGERVLLAETAGVIRTIADNYPPTQVYDVYLLAMENVPGWWVYMANLVPFVGTAIQDLQARNPGLEFRTHWIRTLAYGRDEEYLPYFNVGSDSNADIDLAYFYPSTMPSGSAVDTYYVPDSLRGRANVDGSIINGYDATDNPAPYALADHFNHAMRLPQERDLFDARVLSGVEDSGAPTFRLLLEDMFTNPHDYTNAIIINVHGELFPFPPLRNYSDPAKDPTTHPEVRVVTHPERLRYDNDEDIQLRVYSYLTDPAASTDRLSVPISVLLEGVNASDVSVASIEGGFDGSAYYRETDSTDDGGNDMYHELTTVSGGTLVRLHNSPLKTPCPGGNCNLGGLDPSKRLYNLDYIPTPLDSGTGSFSRDLRHSGDSTKNTARWIINIDRDGLGDDRRWDFQTRIDDDLTTGTMYPSPDKPANLSETYVWRGDDTWSFGDGTKDEPGHVPLTERFQIMGDPRHNPYADLYEAYDLTNNPLGTGYNRYFDDFHDGSGNFANDSDYWPGFAVKNDGDSRNDLWQSRIEIDMNRAFQTLRQAVTRSNSLWTTMTGFSYYYVGIGNEIGYDSANGFANSIPVSRKPFDGGSGSRNEMSITTAQSGGVKYIKENTTNGWWGLNWLGELYPDTAYTGWSTKGNLATGTGSQRYIRVRRDAITDNLPAGTTFENAQRRTQQEGCTTFFSVGASNSKFHHTFSGGDGDLQSDGQEIADRFNFGIPDTVSANRPFYFNLNGSGGVPDNYLDSMYVGSSSLTASELAEFYDHPSSGVTTSALLGVDGPGEDMGFIVVNGIAQTVQTGSAFMSRWSVLTMLQSFMVGGLYSGSERIVQVPQTELLTPNELTDLDDPSSISLTWQSEWNRWDGLDYTENYASNFSESVTLDYVVLYSEDNGATWAYVQNGAAAVPGERPTGSMPTTTATALSWSVPASKFPQGSYVIRIEAYRRGLDLHYAYHQRKVYIKR